jgi:hypothetical protein
MVGDARFVNVKLLTRKLGGTEINIVLNIFAEFASQKYGLKHKSCMHVVFCLLLSVVNFSKLLIPEKPNSPFFS